MSTFKGVLNEFPLISIDRFIENDDIKKNNYLSSTYFLSHCHTDHMIGLKDEKFENLLDSRGFSKIYLSDVSEHLLKNDPAYSHLSKHLVSLPLEQPTIVLIPDLYGIDNSRVVVTLLTAGHCPGSVMFLIEGENERILYTGDFRLPVGSAARINCLHDKTGCLKTLDTLYIDTTFCNKKSLFIPTREQCLDVLIPLVQSWLSKGQDYVICFYCPAHYAYEFVFVELFKRLGEKTHVTDDKLKKYQGIKIIEDAVTSISWNARIHACMFEKEGFQEKIYHPTTPCGYHTVDEQPIKVRHIKPSAMFFTKNQYSNIAQYDTRTQLHRVCYSTHSSLVEMRDMVSYLRPKRVHPTVIKNQTVKEILHLLHAPLSSDLSDSDSEVTESPLGLLKSNDDDDGDYLKSSCSIPFYDDCYTIPGLPKPDQNSNMPIEDHLTKISSVPNSSESHNINETIISPKERIPHCIIANTSSDTSVLKWNYQLLSSDNENVDPNSSFDSSIDKSDSDCIRSNSQEQYLNILDYKKDHKNYLDKSKLEDFVTNKYEGKLCREYISFKEETSNETQAEISHLINKEKKVEASSQHLGVINVNTEAQLPLSLPPFTLEKSNHEFGVSILSKPKTSNHKIAEKSCFKSAEFSTNNDLHVNEKPESVSLNFSTVIANESSSNLAKTEKGKILSSSQIKENVLEGHSSGNSNLKKNEVKFEEGSLASTQSNECLQNILSLIYSSDSEDSDKLENCSSWRQNKLVLDVYAVDVTPFSKVKKSSSQKSSLSIESELSKLNEAVILNSLGKSNILIPLITDSIKSIEGNVSLQNDSSLNDENFTEMNISEHFNDAITTETNYEQNKSSKFFEDKRKTASSCGAVVSKSDCARPFSSAKNIFDKITNFDFKSKVKVIDSSPIFPDSKKSINMNPFNENMREIHKSFDQEFCEKAYCQTNSTNSLNLSSCSSFSISKLPNISESDINNCSLKFSSGTNSSNSSNSIKTKAISFKDNISNNLSQMSCSSQSKYHHNIFGPHFKKKQYSFCQEDPDIVCLGNFKKESITTTNIKESEIISISSDDDCEVSSQNENYSIKTPKDVLKHNNPYLKSFSPIDSVIIAEASDDNDVEILDDSPSLLAPKFSFADMTASFTEAVTDKPITSCKKRKSDERNCTYSSKTQKIDMRPSPIIFNECSSIESTPEDFLPPTQKNFSSYSSFTCRNISDY